MINIVSHRLIPLLFLGLGIFLLVQVVMPFISFKIWEAVVYPQQNVALVSPYPEKQAVLGISIENEPSIKNTVVGFLSNDNKNNFPAVTSSNKRIPPAPYKNFTLTIPGINLINADVIVDSNDLDAHLSHLPGSALPGEKGNVFISGHSSLPIFFRQGNYKAIFSKLPDIKKGDVIDIEAGGQKYEYIVKGLSIVDPKDIGVINPPNSTGRFMSLMTCVPPGLYLKRLVVLAELK